jgi:transposase InsO family protein
LPSSVRWSLLVRHLFERVCRDEGIGKERATVLRVDHGASLRFFALAAKLVELGMAHSFSKPRVSNDNAYAESLFRTMK